MRIKIEKIRKQFEIYLKSRGLTQRESKIIVDDYIEGELLGKKSHGLMAFKSIDRNLEVRKKSYKIVKNLSALTIIDGQGDFGQLVAEEAVSQTIKKAKKNGLALAGANNFLPFLRPGSQAEKFSQKDLIGIVINNGGGPLIAPPGGKEKVFSTNPIGFAIPTTGQPIVCDMAISKKAWGEVRLAERLNRKLPKDSFIDKLGKVTLDPLKVFAALPFGDYKGFNLGILTEVLTGILVGAGYGYKKKFYGKEMIKAYRGAIFLAIDPQKFVGIKKFKRQSAEMIKFIKGVKKVKGVKEIYISGERAYRCKEKVLRRGWIEVDGKVMGDLENFNLKLI